jgi:hypothetical protein
MTTVGISCPLGIESWQSTRTPRLDAFHSYKTRSANLRKCRPHGTWPGFWQLVSIHGCFRSPIQVPRSQPFPQLPWPYRRDWHSRCIPCAEEMLAMRSARAINACFPLRWSLCWQLLLDLSRQLVLRMLPQIGSPGAGSIGQE